MKAIPKMELEDEVARTLLAILSESNLAKPIANAICEMQSKGSPALMAIDRRITEVTTEINNVMSAIKMGIVTDSTKDELLKLENEKKELENKRAEESLGTHRYSREQIEMALKTLAGRAINDVRQRRSLLDAFVKRVEVWEDRSLSIEWNIFGFSSDSPTAMKTIIRVRIDDCLLRHQKSTRRNPCFLFFHSHKRLYRE